MSSEMPCGKIFGVQMSFNSGASGVLYLFFVLALSSVIDSEPIIVIIVQLLLEPRDK